MESGTDKNDVSMSFGKFRERLIAMNDGSIECFIAARVAVVHVMCGDSTQVDITRSTR